MYRFYINNIDNDYHYTELARVFLPEDSFEVIPVDLPGGNMPLGCSSYIINKDSSADHLVFNRSVLLRDGFKK